jgi:hypothetical protein
MKVAIIIAQVQVVPVEVPSLNALQIAQSNEDAMESFFEGVVGLNQEPDVELGVKNCPDDVAPVLKLALVDGHPRFVPIIDGDAK